MTPHPSVQRLVRVARALGPLTDRVVFIGGAVAPLLHTHPVMPSARQTKDVDAVAASLGYADAEALDRALEARRFVHVVELDAHAHRWRSPDGDLLDLVPAGRHLGGSGSALDAIAIESAVTVQVEDVRIRHLSAPLLLAMKFAAFADRGAGDWLASHDIEDVIALLASRPSVIAEIATAATSVRQRLTTIARALVANDALDDVLAAHLNDADDPAAALRLARTRLTEIAALH